MATSFDLGGLLGSAFGADEYGDLLTPEQQSSIRNRAMLSAAAALLQAGGPSTTRTTLGQALGSALTAGQAGAERAQQSALAGMMTRQKLEEARRAREMEENIAKILGGGQQIAPAAGGEITPDMALAAPVTPEMPAGPTVARAGMIGQAAPAAPAMSPNEMQAQRYRDAARLYTSRGRTEDAKRMIDIAEQLAPTRQKVIGEPIQTRTGWVQRTESGGFIQLPKDFEPQVKVKPIGEPLTVTDEASGNQILVQRFDDNTIKPLEGFGPKRDLVLQTVDGKIVAIDKNKVTAGQTFGTGTYIPPAERERLDMERERLKISRDEFERGNYERVETPSGIMYVSRVPGGRVIPLADVSGEPLMGMEAQRLQIALRQLDISQAEFDRGRYEKTVTDQGIFYVPKVPGMPIIPITDAAGKPLKGFTPSPSEVRTLEATGTPVTFENVMRLRRSGAATTNVNVTEGQKGFENEMKLGAAFRGEPIYKDFNEMKTAYGQVLSSLNQGTPIGDVAGATKVMKLLDPGSVVRESELGIAMAAGGRMDRLRNYFDMWSSGNKLTPTQRDDFKALSNELYAAAAQAYNDKRNEYMGFGNAYNFKNLNTALGAPATAPSIMRREQTQTQNQGGEQRPSLSEIFRRPR